MKIGEYFFKTPFSFLGIYSENLQDHKQFNFKFSGGAIKYFSSALFLYAVMVLIYLLITVVLLCCFVFSSPTY